MNAEKHSFGYAQSRTGSSLVRTNCCTNDRNVMMRDARGHVQAHPRGWLSLCCVVVLGAGLSVARAAGAAPGGQDADGEEPLRWTLTGTAIRQEFTLGPAGFTCTSLVHRKTSREWIHPTSASDEFRVDLEMADGETTILVGRGRWECMGHSTRDVGPDWRELRIVLKTPDCPVEIERTYHWHKSLPIVRQWSGVKNRSDQVLVVRRLDSFRLRVAPTLDDLTLHWMNNYPRGMLPARGTVLHRRQVGENVCQVLRSGPYSPDCAWFGLTVPDESEGLIGGWEWSGPMAVAFGDMTEPALIKGYWNDLLVGTDERFGDLTSPCLIHGGLDPEGMREPLPPGAALSSPVGWYGLFTGDLDEAAALSHALVNTTLGPGLPDNGFPWVGYCTWASSMDTAKTSPFIEKGTHPWFPTQENLLSQVEAAADLGCDLFIWDYGWFPRVGDWWIDKARFPDGPAPLADAVRARRMKLGLWIGFGCANEESEVIRTHPDWQAEWRGAPWPGKFPQITGASMWGERALCLGHRPVVEWVKQRLSHVIETFGVDWLKHDFDVITLCDATHHTHTPGDGRVATCRGFYEIMDFIREKYPYVICENWMNSTGVPDYGVLRRHHVQLIGDAYQPFLLRQMFYGHTQIFPPDRQHRYLRLDRSKGDLPYTVRSVCLGGPWTLLNDPRLLDEARRASLEMEIARYKKHRHLFRKGNVYRLVGRPHARGWDATQFFDPSTGEGIVYFFRNDSDEATQALVLKGLAADQVYVLESVDSDGSIARDGRSLMSDGIKVELSAPNRSGVILMRREPSSRPAR